MTANKKDAQGLPIAAPLTNAQRQANLRRERDAAGLVEVRNLWVHPDDVTAIRGHASYLAALRAAGKAAG